MLLHVNIHMFDHRSNVTNRQIIFNVNKLDQLTIKCVGQTISEVRHFLITRDRTRTKTTDVELRTKAAICAVPDTDPTCRTGFDVW